MTIENRRSHHAFSQAFQLEEAVLMAVIYAKATRPTRPAIMANAGLLLLLAAPVKVATGAVVAATGVTEEYHTLLAVVAATGVEAGGGAAGAGRAGVRSGGGGRGRGRTRWVGIGLVI